MRRVVPKKRPFPGPPAHVLLRPIQLHSHPIKLTDVVILGWVKDRVNRWVNNFANQLLMVYDSVTC